MPLITWEDTLACMEVRETGADRYSAPNIRMPYHRIFGGQLLAQMIAVGSAAGEGKFVKSLHAIFPAEGDLARPVQYTVRPIRVGRTFASLSVQGEQPDRGCVVAANVSLHVREDGFSHQIDPPAVEGPRQARPTELSMIPWETRVVGGVDLTSRDAGPPEYAFWMRAPTLPDAAVLHQGLLAHATDLTAIGTVLRPHPGIGESDAPERIHTAVTSHTVWFHRSLRMDEWLLVHQQSPISSGSRGFATGHVFTEPGELVASFGQESMLRLRDPQPGQGFER